MELDNEDKNQSRMSEIDSLRQQYEAVVKNRDLK